MCQQGQAEIKVKKNVAKKATDLLCKCIQISLILTGDERQSGMGNSLSHHCLPPFLGACIINSEYPGYPVASASSHKAEADSLLHRLLCWEMAGVLQESTSSCGSSCHRSCRWGGILHSPGQYSPFAFYRPLLFCWPFLWSERMKHYHKAYKNASDPKIWKTHWYLRRFFLTKLLHCSL